MPHQILQRTLEALQVPTMLVATYNGNEILAVCRRTQTEISGNLLQGSDFAVVMKEMGLNPEETAFMQVADGREEMASRLLHLSQVMNQPAWCVVSRMPDIPGYPPCAFVTIHTQPAEEDKARIYHMRDRLAVETAVLMDQMRTDARQVARMATGAWQQVEQVSQTWLARLSEIEPQLPHN